MSNASGNAINAVLQLALMLVLFRILDDHQYAAFMMARILIGLLEMTSDFGGRLWATREFAVSTAPRRVLHNAAGAKLFYTIASAAILLLVPFSTLEVPSFLLCVLVAASQPGCDPFLWYLRSKERLDVEAMIVLSGRIAIVGGILLAAGTGHTLNVLLLVWLTCNVVRVIIESRFALIREMLNRTDHVSIAFSQACGAVAGTIQSMFPVGTALVLTCLFQRLSLYLVEANATTHEFKIYSTAFTLVNTSGFIATGIFVSSFAPLARAIEVADASSIKAVIRRKLILVTIVFLPVCLVGVLLSVPIAGMVPLPGFTDVARVMALLMPGLYLSCINMGLKYTLNAWSLNWQDVGAVVIGIVALYIATIFNGGMSWWTAGAFGWVTAEATLLIVRIGLLWKQKKHSGVPMGLIFGSAAALVLMVAISH